MAKTNKAGNKEFRSCFSEEKGDCPHASKNEHGNPCCTIDKIVQIEFYSCTPQEIIDKISQEG